VAISEVFVLRARQPLPANAPDVCPLPKSFKAAMRVAGAERFAKSPGKWNLARALVEELGSSSGMIGVTHGSGEKLRKLAKALEDAGNNDFSYSYLDKIWKLGSKFKDANILASVPFTAYFEAGKPEVFERACERIEKYKRERASLRVDDVKVYQKLDKIEREERERNERSALRGRDPKIEEAKLRADAALDKSDNEQDKAIKWLKSEIVQRLSEIERLQLYRKVTAHADKTSALATMLQPASYIREAAE
jgi:hypothetical protein